MGKRIAGINLAKYGSLSVIDDGKVEFYLEEERVSRIKRDVGAKALANKYIDSTVDAVTICDCFTRYTKQIFIERTRIKNELCKIIKGKGCKKILDYRQRHHECHAANAFYNSGFDDAVCLVMDGKGSYVEHNGLGFCETESIYNYDGEFTPVFKHYSTFWTNVGDGDALEESYWDDGNFYSNRTSIGQAWRIASRYCGFDELDAGKTMGLSGYFDSGTVDLFEEENGHSVCTKDMEIPFEIFTERHNSNVADHLAYNLQKSSEKHALFMVKKAIELTGKKNVVCSGGFFLNCVANYRIMKELDINLYVDPLSYDGGISIGSALLAHHKL